MRCELLYIQIHNLVCLKSTCAGHIYIPYLSSGNPHDKWTVNCCFNSFCGDFLALAINSKPVMKLIVAADACVLVLNKPWPLYRNVKEILLYPSAYYAPQSTRDSAGLVSYHNTVRLGESWPGGTLVLSWHDVLEGNRLPSDGHNLVFHEFAHQLDQETGKTTGTPILKSSADYKEWGRVFSRAFTQLKSHVAYSMPHVIHSYGATNEAEFFAVLTETFLEKPAELRRYDPEIYSMLVNYYQFDPIVWH